MAVATRRKRTSAPEKIGEERPLGIGDAAVITREDLEGGGGQPGRPSTDGEAPEEAFGGEYALMVEITGRVPMLFHAWNAAAVEEKSKAVKGGRVKKTDNLESYVYRDPDGFLCVPAGNIWACLSDTARSMADPRSPRKSLRDLVRAGIRIEPLSVVFVPKKKNWDFEDRRRVTVQRSAITRTRPALKEGWMLRFTVNVLAGDYLSPMLVHDLLVRAGRFTGLNDFRPLFGLFNVTHFKQIELKA